MDEDTLSVKEVAAYLGINASTVRRKRLRGELIAHEVHTVHGVAWRFPRRLLPAPGAPLDAPPAEIVSAPVGAPLGVVAPPMPMLALVERLEAQAERIGRLEAERDAALARVAALERSKVPWWRFWYNWRNK